MQVVFNSAQARSLKEFLEDNVRRHLHNDEGATVVITQQGASIYVATDLASASIDADGTVDEN